tara:strand:+ start:169 stop:1470 length:1302 start_codon:yes stop_codon:yes gene_type:complete
MRPFKNYFILNEGGLAGHMDHLYDHWDITFGNIKDILTAASNGELEGTVKTDGANLFITYNIEQRDARAVRNKENARSGGMDAVALAKKFSEPGRGSAQAAFVHAFNMFKKGIGALSDDEIIYLFGREGNIFYSAEIIDERLRNVINYDVNTLQVHQNAEYSAVNYHTGEIKSGYDRERSTKLYSALEKMNQNVNGSEYSIIGDAIVKLKALEDDTALREALITIRKLGVRDRDKIKDYLIKSIRNKIKQTIPYLKPRDVKILVIKIVESKDEIKWKQLGFEKAPTITQIVKNLDHDAKLAVKDFYDNRNEHVKEFIEPLEKVIHNFAVEMLKTLESALIINSQGEVDRVKSEVTAAIKNIEASGHEEAMAILHKQLEKLQSIENVSAAEEGFVFRFNGHSYKFTGNFAPVNQILGLFKYGRGKIKPEDLRGA